jgi:peptidoglycan/xylan/chitin deacetylase (PgdA/CDA1 family)
MPSSLLQPVVSWVRRARNRLCNLVDPPVLVLIYHRVAALESDPQMLAVSPDNFRAQLRYLKDNFPLVRFEDDWSKLTEPAVAVTFDDGYADNALAALPALEQAGVPATFFVSTGAIGSGREFWWDELERLVLADGTYPAWFAPQLPLLRQPWPTGSAADRQALYRELQPLLKKLEPLGRETWLEQLRQWSQRAAEGRQSHLPMTLEELRLLAQSPLVTIGAHTVSHTAMSCQTPAAQLEEMTSSKRQLESWLGREIATFSYPFGARGDYSRQTAGLCRQTGFLKAAANFPGQAHRWTDPCQIPRQLVRNWPVELFAQKLQGYWLL